MRARRLLRGIGVTVGVAISLALLVRWRASLFIYVRNDTFDVMRDVRFEMSGRAYRIGDIDPGEAEYCRVLVTEETGIRLSSRERSIIPVDIYIDVHHAGSVTLWVLEDGTVSIDRSRLRISFLAPIVRW